MILDTLVHEIKYLVRNFFSFVEEYLLFIILPVECEVLYINLVPMIVQLHARRVDNPLNFVGNYEF